MFDNPFSMVVAIVLIASIAGVLKARFQAQHRSEDDQGNSHRLPDPDAARLREELKALKERVAVLERIATDKTSRLESEIEALRDER